MFVVTLKYYIKLCADVVLMVLLSLEILLGSHIHVLVMCQFVMYILVQCLKLAVNKEFWVCIESIKMWSIFLGQTSDNVVYRQFLKLTDMKYMHTFITFTTLQ